MSEEKMQEEKEKTLEEIRAGADTKACAVQKILHFVEQFLSGPMCGKCFPCAFGCYEAKVKAERLSSRCEHVEETDIALLKRIGSLMRYGSRCKKGRDTGKYITDILTDAAEELSMHLSRICPKKECISLIEYRINPGLCTMCGKCLKACRDEAILGETRKPFLSGYFPFEIRQKRCTKCGECIKVCPENAVEVHSVEMPEMEGIHT